MHINSNTEQKQRARLHNKHQHNEDDFKQNPFEDDPVTTEYRLIPIDEKNYKNRDAVDINELYATAYNNRHLIYKITGIFVLLGLLVALLSPVEYESEALLLPEVKNNQSEAQNLLNTYGGLLGIGSSASSSSEGTISPTVYPKIVGSLSFENNLLNSELYIPRLDSTMTGYTYFEHFHAPVSRMVWNYTLGLPGTIAGGGTSRAATAGLPPAIQEQLGEGTLELTQEQLAVVKKMRDRVAVSIDAETGVLQVSALMPDPVIAAQVCKKVITMLKSYLTEYSTQKAKENLDYVESQQQQAQLKFQDAQTKLAKFRDQNVNLNTARAQTLEQRLQAKYDLAYNSYNTISQRLMQAQMQVQDQKPVLKVLQSANIPVEKSQPQRILIIVIAFTAGLVVSFLYIAGKLIKKNWMTST